MLCSCGTVYIFESTLSQEGSVKLVGKDCALLLLPQCLQDSDFPNLTSFFVGEGFIPRGKQREISVFEVALADLSDA